MEAVFIFDTGLACDNIGQGEFYESRLRYFLQSILSSGISNTGLESSQAHIETTIIYAYFHGWFDFPISREPWHCYNHVFPGVFQFEGCLV